MSGSDLSNLISLPVGEGRPARDQPLPLCLSVPVIAGLSGGLWWLILRLGGALTAL